MQGEPTSSWFETDNTPTVRSWEVYFLLVLASCFRVVYMIVIGGDIKRLCAAIGLAIIGTTFAISTVAAQADFTPGTVGIDVGWPDCSDTIPAAAYGIVGITDGLGYSENPCLSSEAQNFNRQDLGLYINTGWYAMSSHINPSSPRKCQPNDEDCLAYNYGYNAGLYALSYQKSQGVTARAYWLDVETDNTWSTDTIQNRNSLQGEADALNKFGAVLGVYSTTAQWDAITGDWINDWPSWGATTWTTATQAETYCTGHEFTGGRSVLMQYLPPDSLDHDVTCPLT